MPIYPKSLNQPEIMIEANHNPEELEAKPVADATACYALDDRQWWKRKLCRFFGHHPIQPDLPEWAKDGIVVNVRINFSLRDRFIIALTGNASVRSWVLCENYPGRIEATSHAMADRPGFIE